MGLLSKVLFYVGYIGFGGIGRIQKNDRKLGRKFRFGMILFENFDFGLF